MQSKQYSVKVYETSVEEESKFMAFFDANYVLFKDHLIVLRGEVSDEIRTYLRRKSLKFMENVTLPEGRTRKKLESELEMEKKKFDLKVNMLKNEFELEKKQLLAREAIVEAKLSEFENCPNKELTIHDKVLRSGQELKVDGDLLILSRVNSGATVDVQGNLIITQPVQGAIRCSGRFMMLSATPKANIMFNGEEIENRLLQDKLNCVEIKENQVIITPV